MPERPTTPTTHSSQLQVLTLTDGEHLHQDSPVALKPNQVQVCFSAVPNANKTSNHLLLTLPPFSQSSTSTALRILDFPMSLHVLTYSTPSHQVFGIIPSHPLPLPMPTSELVLIKTCYHFSTCHVSLSKSYEIVKICLTWHPPLQSNLPFVSPPPWPQALSCRVYGRGLSPCEKIATQPLTAIELGVLAQKRYRCTQDIWSEWVQGEWEWLELRRKSAGNQHLRSVPEEEEELAQGWTGHKQTRRVGATVARVSRRWRLTMVKVAENQEIPRKGHWFHN